MLIFLAWIESNGITFYFNFAFWFFNVLLVGNSTVFGRAIKNEYLSLGVLATAFGSAYLATRGGKTSAPAKPQTVQQAKESIPVHASSS